MRRRTIPPVLALPVLALVLGTASACGQSKGDEGIASANGAKPAATATAPANADADNQEQFRKFAQCMRQHGVDVPDPDPNGGGPRLGGGGGGAGGAGSGAGGGGRLNRNDPNFQKALQACRSQLPNGGARPTPDAAQLEALRQFAQCMRTNGVDVPDPDPNGGGFGLGLGGGGGANGGPRIDRNDPNFQKALQACRDKLPQRRGGNDT